MERSQAQVKKLLEREQKRQLYRKLGNLLHPQNTQGLGKVDVPNIYLSLWLPAETNGGVTSIRANLL
jgi:hypothetical protein